MFQQITGLGIQILAPISQNCFFKLFDMNSANKSASGSFKIKIPTKRSSSASFEQTIRKRRGQEEESELRIEEQFILRLRIPEEDREKFREQVRNRQYVDDISILFKGTRRLCYGSATFFVDIFVDSWPIRLRSTTRNI
jgi:hypothetical protein